MDKRTLEWRLLEREKHKASRAMSAERKFNNALGENIPGSTALLVTLRHLMSGGHYFFGLHGGAIAPFFSALYQDESLCKWYVEVPHEQMAVHAAEGLADSTGKVGVVVVTSGPGVANTFSGVADAYADSVPLVVISGNVATDVVDNRPFQGLPVAKCFRPITKKVLYVNKVGGIPSALMDAFRLAKSGRPGPVIVDIPVDVLKANAPFHVSSALNGLEAKVVGTIDESSIEKLADKISRAKRPLLYVGGGVRIAEAWNELRQLVEKTGIPVVHSLKGKGAVPDTEPLCIGPLGMYGSYAANLSAYDADLLIAVGARFADRTTGNPNSFAPNAIIAQLDIDPQGIGPKKGGRQPQIVVKGDAKQSLNVLNSLMRSQSDLSEWRAQIENWEREHPFLYKQQDGVISSALVTNTVSDMLRGEKVIYVTDVGLHQMEAMRWLNVSEPRDFLTSGGFGVMGYGMPAAFGAKLANPGKRVVVVSGDLSAWMLPHTLKLYSSYKPDITVVVIDNSSEHTASGNAVRDFFTLSGVTKFTKRQWKTGEMSIAEHLGGYQIDAVEVSDPRLVNGTLEQAMSRRGPQVVVFKTDPYEDVRPVMPPGKSVKETVFGQDMAPTLNHYSS